MYRNLSLAKKIIAYKIFHQFINPFNITLCVTKKCNAKCLMCGIWQEKNPKEISLSAIKSIFKRLNPFFVTLTGGEPFLRDDLPEIVEIVTKKEPRYLVIPTNGIQTNQIIKLTKEILKKNLAKQIIINLSLDGSEIIHNRIRGGKYYNKSFQTFKELKRIQGIKVGLNTIILPENLLVLQEFYKSMKLQNPHHHNFEIAQKRKELSNEDSHIFNKYDYAEVSKFLNFLISQKEVGFLRKKYYRYLKKVLQGKMYKCYAGISSLYISEETKFLECGVKGKPFDKGNLKPNLCTCGSSNSFYSNLLFEPINYLL